MMASSPYLAKADSVYIIRPENLLLVSAVQPEKSIPIFLFSIQIILRFSEKNWDTAKTNYNVFPSASHAQ